MYIPVSAGELIDKLTILAIRLAKAGENMGVARVAVYNEFKALDGCLLELLDGLSESEVDQLAILRDKLRIVNEDLWELEDEIRRSEHGGDFGNRFVEIARQIYKTNDLRAEIKSKINGVVGSAVQDHKNYERYDRETDG